MSTLLVDVLDEIRGAQSPKSKKEVMEKYKDNKMLKKVIYYTYNPYMKYGITKKTFENYQPNGEPNKSDKLYDLLDELAASNINDELRYKFVNYVNFFDERWGNIMKGIAIKDLELGVSATTINKVWPKLIPTFELQLAARFKPDTLEENEYVWVTEKFDGIRCVCVISKGTIKFFTRQGKEIFGLNEIVKEVKLMGLSEFVLDGELLFNGDYEDSGDQYKKTTKIINSKMENKTQITFNIFDMLPLNEFKSGESHLTYEFRRKQLSSLYQSEVTRVAPVLYEGTDHSKIMEVHKQMVENKREGCMINRNHVYQCKRTKSLLKVKVMNDADLEIIGYEEGKGENEGRLGAFIVNYKGNKVNVGSGYSKLQRIEFWKNREMFIGQIIKVQYFEESTNQQGGLSLRFPVFLELRTDKSEPSYE